MKEYLLSSSSNNRKKNSNCCKIENHNFLWPHTSQAPRNNVLLVSNQRPEHLILQHIILFIHFWPKVWTHSQFSGHTILLLCSFSTEGIITMYEHTRNYVRNHKLFNVIKLKAMLRGTEGFFFLHKYMHVCVCMLVHECSIVKMNIWTVAIKCQRKIMKNE